MTGATEGDHRTKVAVITGGSGGIGKACGEVLARRGYDVVLTARRPEPLARAADELGVRWIAADASDEHSFAAVVDGLERVDLLVHSAGILGGTFVRKESVATFDEVIRANLRSTFVTVSAVLPKMGVGGRIILVSSSAGRRGMKGRSAYSASKAGMNAFAEALADEVARDGINVNTLVVAPVDTDMLEKVTFPMHTLSVRDVAAAVEFLDGLDPSVVLPELAIRAQDTGPLAPDPVLPEAYRAKDPPGGTA
jgi:NAD(P)-dependent dehydrogenase (short-subunit alcohol dehydrogenase family)